MYEIKPLTRNEYNTVMNGLGYFDELTINLSYRLYLALFNEDDKEIVKAMNDTLYNTSYFKEDRLN